MSRLTFCTRHGVQLLAALMVLGACGDSGTTESRPAVAAIRVSPSNRELSIGATTTFSARVEDSRGRILEGRSITWGSSNEVIAAVSSSGVVTGRAPGVAQITATSEGQTGAAMVVVTAVPAPVHELAISAGGGTIVEGDSRPLTVRLWDAQGNELTGRTVTWSTDKPDVAVVTPAGVLEAKSPGVLVITATSEGVGNSLGLTVTPNPAPVASVSLDVATASLHEGATRQLTATPKDGEGRPVSGRGLQWTSSDPTIVHVAALGLVTAIRPGTATITVKVDGKTASAVVTAGNEYSFNLVYESWSGVGGVGPKLTLGDLRAVDGSPTAIQPVGVTGVWDPAPSPDGSKIAFAGWFANAERGIYVVNRDGSGLTRLTTSDFDNQPAWSPDGAKIAFRRWETNDDPDIWVVPATGGAPVNLTGAFPDHAGEHAPTWSPQRTDGKYHIAYSRVANGRAHIYRITESGESPTPITSGADVYDDTPAWSPDGQTIVFQRHAATAFGDLWLVNAAGGNERMLMPFADPAGPQWAPAWSPDGRLIAFASKHETYGAESSVYQIYTVWANGTKLARRTFDNTVKQQPAFITR